MHLSLEVQFELNNKPAERVARLPRGSMTVRDLGEALKVPPVEIIKELMKRGVMAAINQSSTTKPQRTSPKRWASLSRPRRAATASPLPLSKASRRPQPRTRWALSHAAAGRYCHGPRRPRQDQPPGRHPRDERNGPGGRCDHAAHRRLPGGRERLEGDVHRHARPRSVHCAAGARRERHGHRGARRRR